MTSKPELNLKVSYTPGTVSLNTKPLSTKPFLCFPKDKKGNPDTNINSQNDFTANSIDDTIFTKDQYLLRFLDMCKDGQAGTSLSLTTLREIMGNNLEGFQHAQATIGGQDWKNILHPIEDKMIISMKAKNRIKQHPWTKVDKNSRLSPMLKSKHIFYETGILPEHYIENPQFVSNIANAVIDPFKRSSQNKEQIFPKTITIDSNFFAFFGFPGFNLTATHVSGNKFTYTISYKASVPNSTEIVINDKTPHYYFEGNDQIHNFIKNSAFPKNDRIKVEHKQFLLFLKEMGDVLQVLIMMMWCQFHTSSDYTMITGDKVVYLLCMLLNLNCIMPSKKCIEVFEAKEYNAASAIKRFGDVKKEILKANEAYIKDVQRVQKRRMFVSIKGQGFDKTDVLPDLFYERVFGDMGVINAKLRNFLCTEKEVSKIEEQIKLMEYNFRLNKFLNITKDKKTVTLNPNKSYTESNVLWGTTLPNTPISFEEYRGSDKTKTFYTFISHPKQGTPETTRSSSNKRKLSVSRSRSRSRSRSPSNKTKKARTSTSLSLNRRPQSQSFKRMMTSSSLNRTRTGGSGKRRRSHEDEDDDEFETLMFPSGVFYDDTKQYRFLKAIGLFKYDGVVDEEQANVMEPTNIVDLFSELESEIHKYVDDDHALQPFYDHVYSNLLYKFDLEKKVVYGDELYEMIQDIRKDLVSAKLIKQFQMSQVQSDSQGLDVTNVFDSPEENYKY
jgi:hypothetical protein